MITMAENEDALKSVLKKREAIKDTPYARYLAKQPPNLVGTTDQISSHINEYRGIGVDHFILRFHFGEEIEGMRLFTEKVKPSL